MSPSNFPPFYLSTFPPFQVSTISPATFPPFHLPPFHLSNFPPFYLLTFQPSTFSPFHRFTFHFASVTYLLTICSTEHLKTDLRNRCNFYVSPGTWFARFFTDGTVAGCRRLLDIYIYIYTHVCLFVFIFIIYFISPNVQWKCISMS